MDGVVHQDTWGKHAFLALAFAYLLVLKALLAPFPFQISSAHLLPDMVICGDHGALDDSGAPADRSHDDSCCDEGCLLRLATFVAPLLALAAVVFRLVRPATPVDWRTAIAGAGPPQRPAARPQSQRAPPLSI